MREIRFLHWCRLVHLTHGDLNWVPAGTQLVKCLTTLVTSGWADPLGFTHTHTPVYIHLNLRAFKYWEVCISISFWSLSVLNRSGVKIDLRWWRNTICLGTNEFFMHSICCLRIPWAFPILDYLYNHLWLGIGPLAYKMLHCVHYVRMLPLSWIFCVVHLFSIQ